ncbi:transcription repressor OFP12 [Diospyros lotus]|uniref:transcription repressor OFP12 n=1 Tax=Diospyros lotus TaxID=55363 RepID=UPI002252D724|nr:transcription repressor OFP12 [Diospyros lotus]
MSSIFWRNFYFCFSKFKCPSAALPPPQEDHGLQPDATTTRLVKNFNSLYYPTPDSNSKSLASSSDFFSSSEDSDDADSSPDFATIFASHRFFFSSPGLSNSIIDSTDSPREPAGRALVPGGIAVQTYSPDPYQDFRRSMQEMIESRRIIDVAADWDYLHELLNCYLTLNPKHTHKFIIHAFSDLLVTLMSSATTIDSHRKARNLQRLL